MEFNVNDEEMTWLKGSFMGRTVDPVGIHCIRKKFDLDYLLSVTLTPMGGNLVLMHALDGVNFEEVLHDKRKVFERWFSELGHGTQVWWQRRGPSGLNS